MNVKRFFLVYLLLPLINLSLIAETRVRFKRFEINTVDTIRDAYFRDINNDGLKDLFITTRDTAKKEMKKLSIYLQRSGGFSDQADTVIKFPKDAVIYDVGHLPGHGDGPAIIFQSAKGLSYYSCQKGTYNQIPQTLSHVSSIYVVPPQNSPIRAQMFHTINRINSSIICIPGHTHLLIIDSSKPDTFENPLQLPLPVMTSLGSNEEKDGGDYDPITLAQRLVIRVPKLFFKRFDKDQTEDLIAVVKDRITVFKGLKKGLFQAKPIYQTSLNLSSGDESGFIKPNFMVHVADANGDGQQDVLVTSARMKTQNSSTKVYLFVNQNGMLPDSPNQVILFANTMGNNMDFQDINGDGSVDLVIPSAKLSLFQFVKILLSQKLNYTKNIHLWQTEGYSKKPDVQLKAQARFNLENPDDLQGAFFYLDGDMNGDGVKDLLKSDSDSGKITIRLGQKGSDKLFSPLIFTELKEKQIPSEIEMLDINDDRHDEIIYRYGFKAPKKLVIWISRI